MQKIVIDTNVFVSALLTPNGNCAKIANAISDEEIHFCYNDRILFEYKYIFSKDKFNFEIEKQNKIINQIIKWGHIVEPFISNIPLPDENDRIFYDTAKTVNAILITGNKKHYPKENFIKTPTEYLKYIKK